MDVSKDSDKKGNSDKEARRSWFHPLDLAEISTRFVFGNRKNYRLLTSCASLVEKYLFFPTSLTVSGKNFSLVSANHLFKKGSEYR